jgi:hypothetical protein
MVYKVSAFSALSVVWLRPKVAVYHCFEPGFGSDDLSAVSLGLARYPASFRKKTAQREGGRQNHQFAPIPPPVLPGSGSKGPFSAPTGAPLRCLQQVEATYLGRLNSVSGQFASGHCHGARAKSLFQCHPREIGGPEKTLEYLNSGFRRNDHKGTLSAFLDTLLRRAIEIHQSYNISVKQTSTLVWQKFPRQPSGVLNLVKPSGRPGKALDNTLPTAILRG